MCSHVHHLNICEECISCDIEIKIMMVHPSKYGDSYLIYHGFSITWPVVILQQVMFHLLRWLFLLQKNSFCIINARPKIITAVIIYSFTTYRKTWTHEGCALCKCAIWKSRVGGTCLHEEECLNPPLQLIVHWQWTLSYTILSSRFYLQQMELAGKHLCNVKMQYAKI